MERDEGGNGVVEEVVVKGALRLAIGISLIYQLIFSLEQKILIVIVEPPPHLACTSTSSSPFYSPQKINDTLAVPPIIHAVLCTVANRVGSHR